MLLQINRNKKELETQYELLFSLIPVCILYFHVFSEVSDDFLNKNHQTFPVLSNASLPSLLLPNSIQDSPPSTSPQRPNHYAWVILSWVQHLRPLGQGD